MDVTPYIFFNGNCAEAIHYYETHIGARQASMMKHAGSPAEAHMPPGWGDKILHARFQIGDTVIMASDAPPGHQHKGAGYALSLSAKSVPEAERFVKGLGEGGSMSMPAGPTFFAEYFAMLTDRFGVPWMVICEGKFAQRNQGKA